MEFGPEVCGNPEAATSREWLLTNRIGGFASSTIIGLNTRRYHGLLTAATKPSLGRLVLLSKLEPTLIIDGRHIDLGSNRYPGVIHPEGFRLLRRFQLEPVPTWTWTTVGVEVVHRVCMVQGKNATVAEWEVRCAEGERAGAVTLEIRPLIAFRDYHSLTHANDALSPDVTVEYGSVSLQPYLSLPRLHLTHNAQQVEPQGAWWYRFQYSAEQERGLDFEEDLFNPLVFRFCSQNKTFRCAVIASTEPISVEDAPLLFDAELARYELLSRKSPVDHPIIRQLTRAADQFVVQRGEFQSIIAGYHWFGDWGRDAMIALPGLLLSLGRWDSARTVLQAFASSIDRGMLPNRFPDQGEVPEYNTVDATLWFFEAARAYVEYSSDLAFIQNVIYPRLKEIIGWHVRGTRFGIRVDVDGLLQAGEPGVQLTWMDAKVGDAVITPRIGKPVEIQALWFHALSVCAQFARQFGEPAYAAEIHGMALHARDSFHAQFWKADGRGLFDVVSGDGKDGSVRPNQVIAASLRYSMLSVEQMREVVAIAEESLLTPMGLRTLAPSDPNYRGRYTGGVWERDSAYHQGTVWPWLLGPFLTAYVRAHERSDASVAQARQWLETFSEHLEHAGLGQVSEIADGDEPHTPRGCIAQAWSVGELLRAATEDVFQVSRRTI